MDSLDVELASRDAPGDALPNRNPCICRGFLSRPISRILSRVTIPLGDRLPGRSSGVPGSSAGSVVGACFALHRTGFGEPPCRHGRWWALTPPFHPCPRRLRRVFAGGGLLSVPLSVGFRRLGFPQRPALRCPDFPRDSTRAAPRGHPACTSDFSRSAAISPCSVEPHSGQKSPSRERITNSPQTRHSRLTPR